MRVKIKGIAHYLPEKIISNQDLIDEESLKIKSSWVEKRIGIKTRHWADESQAASDLAVNAVKKLNLGEFKGSVWVTTISGDYYTPSTSSIVKNKLNLCDDCPTYDINAACAGHIFSLEMAAMRLLNSEEREAIVIATETRSKFLNPKDRRTVFLFGDGAVAIHLTKDKDTDKGFEWFLSKTFRSESLDIYIPGGGSVAPYPSLDDIKDCYITMNDGPRIFELTTSALVDNILENFKKNKMTVDDYDYFVFHQGNMSIITTVLERLNVPITKTHINFDVYGNTSSASMGIALSKAVEKKLIKENDRVLIMAMGAGHHMGMASLVWG